MAMREEFVEPSIPTVTHAVVSFDPAWPSLTKPRSVPRPTMTAVRFRSSASPRSRVLVASRVALVVAVCVGAYHYSLETLLRGLTLQTPLAHLGLVPLLSLLLALVVVVQPPKEPDIHDRYLDWIVGVPLLTAALALMWIMPSQLSTYFWLWRLDLLSLPLFVAAAVALTFGARALWRLRVPIALLCLAWPAPYLLLRDGRLASEAVGVLALAAAVAVLAPRLHSAIRGRRGPWSGLSLGAPGRPAVTRPWPAILAVAAAGALAGTANQGLRPFELVSTPLGQPRLQPSAVATHPVPGWVVEKTASYTWVTSYLGRSAAWDRFVYAPSASHAPHTPVTLDLIQTPDRGALDAFRVQDSYHLARDHLLEGTQVALPGGIVAREVLFQGPSLAGSWTAVYWEWPVETPSGLGYQRVVLNLSGPPDAGTQAFLVSFGRQVVLATAGSAG
jgi:hypothetical protein